MSMIARLWRTAKEAPIVVIVTIALVYILWSYGFDVVTILTTSALAALFIFWFRRFLGF